MPKSSSSFEVIAHRGFSARAPENTLAAFEAAIQCRAHRVEFDVQLTRDGIPVVIHDDSLERTTNSCGLVRERMHAEIRRLDAGAWSDPRFQGERVPSLDQVLALCRGRIPVNIEVKACQSGAERLQTAPAPGKLGSPIEEQVVEAVRRHESADRAILSSFDGLVLERLRGFAPEITRELLHEDPRRAPGPEALKLARELECAALSVSRDELAARPSLVVEAHAEGLGLKVYTVDDPATMREFLALGVDGIFTNRPDALLELAHKEFPRLLARSGA